MRCASRCAPAGASTNATTPTTTIFSIVDAVLIQPPPFPEPERLVTLWQTDPDNDDRPDAVAPANFLDWREQARSFAHVAAMDPWSFDFTGAGAPEVLYGSLVTAGLLRQLLTESVVIAALGGLGGLVVTAAAIESIPALMPADVPGLARIAVNGRLLAFSVGLVVATALLWRTSPW